VTELPLSLCKGHTEKVQGFPILFERVPGAYAPGWLMPPYGLVGPLWRLQCLKNTPSGWLMPPYGLVGRAFWAGQAFGTGFRESSRGGWMRAGFRRGA